MSDNTEKLNEELNNTSVENLALNNAEESLDLKKYLNYVAIAVVVIVVAVGGYYYNAKVTADNNLSALKEYDKVEEFIKLEDYDKALNGGQTAAGKSIGLLGIVNQYGSTELSNSAALQAGYMLLEKNQTNKALQMFEKALDAEADVVKMGANAGLGACYEQMNKNADAAKHYEIASGIATQKVLKGKYKYFAAINYDLAKNKEKSVELYKDLVNEDQYSEFAGLSKIALTKLGINFE